LLAENLGHLGAALHGSLLVYIGVLIYVKRGTLFFLSRKYVINPFLRGIKIGN
jgi:hypothetical protein